MKPERWMCPNIVTRYPRPGRWVCPNQPDIIIKIDPVGQQYPGWHGPWVNYRFDFESPEIRGCTITLVAWEALEDFGYSWHGHPWDLIWVEMFNDGQISKAVNRI